MYKQGRPLVRQKKNSAQGSVLIEILIYFLLFMFLGMLLFQGATALQSRNRSADTKTAARLSLHAAADALSRDLRGAPTRVADWQKLGPREIQWRTDTVDISWYAEHGHVCRAHKKYNPRKKMWSERFVSVVATGITHVSFQPVLSTDDVPHVIKVMFTLEHESHDTVHGVVTLRNQEGV